MLTTEMPEARHAILLLEADNGMQPNPHVIDEIVKREARIHNGDLDRELAVKDGIVYIDRLAFDQSLNDRYRDMHEASEEPTSHAISEHGPIIADFSKPGLISSLYFKPDESALDPLPDDYIEIKTAAMGLNWKDLAVCTGRNDMNTFSQECSGTILRCGSSVQDFRKGDRVYALAWGKFGNTARLPASMAQRMRTDDRFDEMAGVPLVFCTAHCAFDRIARLKRGEKVLIQGATGGLGLAALQLARRIGAQIWCTVGTPEKAQFLIREFGVEEDRIFSSRDVGDLPRMLATTGGRGFDVILSSSTGSMMHESWRCIAPLGRFVDVGRLDVQNSATLAMDVFARNATYSSFDLSVMAAQDHDFCSR
jgi:NADPH:quinone reductase-like Zn-dependent oxidoreductase